MLVERVSKSERDDVNDRHNKDRVNVVAAAHVGSCHQNDANNTPRKAKLDLHECATEEEDSNRCWWSVSTKER